MIRQESHRKALVLIVVVYIIASLSMLAFALAYRSRIAIKRTSLLTERLQQDQLALAACTQARSILAADDRNVDCLDEPWSGRHKLIPVEIAYQSVDTNDTPWEVNWELVDESAKINVNLASADLFLEIESLDEAAVASILDWIDQDDIPNPDGAEDDYYSSLESAYKCKNGPVDSMEELLFIKGISSQIYYGSNMNQGGNLLTETSADSAEFTEENWQDNNVGLYDMMTVYGDGRININTASRQVLGAIPLLSDAAVSEIVSRQKSLARKFSSIADIENSDNFNVTDKLLLTQIAKFNSNHFQLIINIRMKGNSFWCEYVAIIERQGKNTHVLSWQRKSRTMLKNIIHFGVNDNESVSSQG